MTSCRRSDPRLGLRRHSYSTYCVDGPNGKVLIRRNGRKFLVGWANRPLFPGFFCREERLLRDARALAERLAGVKRTGRRSSPADLAFLVSV